MGTWQGSRGTEEHSRPPSKGQDWRGAGAARSPGPGRTHKGPLKCCPAPHNCLFSCLQPPDPSSSLRGPVRRQTRVREQDAVLCRLARPPCHLPSPQAAPAPAWCWPQLCSGRGILTWPLSPPFCCLLTSCLLLPEFIPPGWKGLNPILTRPAIAQHRGNTPAHPSAREHIPLASQGGIPRPLWDWRSRQAGLGKMCSHHGQGARCEMSH